MSHIKRVWVPLLLAVALLAATVGTAAADSQSYVVQPGDTLFRISVRFGVSMDAIRSANGFTGDRIYAGQTLIIPDGSAPANPPPATGGQSGAVHVVQAGETLFTIGLKYGMVWTKIAAANNIAGTTVFIGQRLTIPGADAPANPPPADTGAPTPPPSGDAAVHIVQPGDTLHKIGVRYGVSWPAIQQANGLQSTIIYTGQRLIIPSSNGGTTTPPSNPAPNNPAPPGGEFAGRYFLVDLSDQTLYAYEGDVLVRSTLVSTGLSATPTVVGTFYVYLRYESTRMRGPGYDLPNVPYTMYFYKGYGLHGTYWHSNFGTPMSHGCVNMPTPEAEWAYHWSTYGTPVVVRY